MRGSQNARQPSWTPPATSQHPSLGKKPTFLSLHLSFEITYSPLRAYHPSPFTKPWALLLKAQGNRLQPCWPTAGSLPTSTFSRVIDSGVALSFRISGMTSQRPGLWMPPSAPFRKIFLRCVPAINSVASSHLVVTKKCTSSEISLSKTPTLS